MKKKKAEPRYADGQPVSIITPGLQWSHEIFRVMKSWPDKDGEWHYQILNLRTEHEVKDCAEHHLAAFRGSNRLTCIAGGLPPKVYAAEPLQVYRANGTNGGGDAA